MMNYEGSPNPQFPCPRLIQNCKPSMTPSLRRAIIFGLVALFSSLIIHHSSFLLAQTTNPPPLDPLISLMVSQPKIDITSPVRPTAAFDPPVVAPGQEAVYRVTFNALEETVDWP